jgi:hypothetical protein
MKSVQLSRSSRRITRPMTVATNTIQGPAFPVVSLRTAPAKNAANASSGSASAAALDTDVKESRALAARTIGTSRLERVTMSGYL